MVKMTGKHDVTENEKVEMYGNYSPVNVSDSLGVIVLGALTLILLLALLRSQGRNRKLLARLAQQGDHNSAER
jgi:hypothetical protein